MKPLEISFNANMSKFRMAFPTKKSARPFTFTVVVSTRKKANRYIAPFCVFDWFPGTAFMIACQEEELCVVEYTKLLCLFVYFLFLDILHVGC